MAEPDRLTAIRARLRELETAPSKGYRVVAENAIAEEAPADLRYLLAEVERLCRELGLHWEQLLERQRMLDEAVREVGRLRDERDRIAREAEASAMYAAAERQRLLGRVQELEALLDVGAEQIHRMRQGASRG